MPETTNNQSGGMWVKASDRLPEEGAAVYAKKFFSHGSFAQHLLYHAKNRWRDYDFEQTYIMDSDADIDLLQWLDEETIHPAEATLSTLRSLLSMGENEDVVEAVKSGLQQWIPLTNTDIKMPRDEDFLLFFDNGDVCRYFEKNFPEAVATHWMPIPNPPTNKQGEAK